MAIGADLICHWDLMELRMGVKGEFERGEVKEKAIMIGAG